MISNSPTHKTKRTMRSRFRPEVTANMRLTTRDLELLRDVYLQRVMSRSQIQRLHFSSTSRCNVRLRLLFDHGFLYRHNPTVAPFGAEGLFSLGKKGIDPVATLLDWEPSVVRSHIERHAEDRFLEHTLAINDAWLAFRDALKNSPSWTLGEWRSEIQCRHEYTPDLTGRSQQVDVFKPDGFLSLRNTANQVNASFFLEIDRGHTSSNNFANKLALHTRFLESGEFERQYHERAFYTLVITTGPRRLKNLKTLVEEKGSDLFCFATFGDVKKLGITGEVWHFPFEEEIQSLL